MTTTAYKLLYIGDDPVQQTLFRSWSEIAEWLNEAHGLTLCHAELSRMGIEGPDRFILPKDIARQ